MWRVGLVSRTDIMSLHIYFKFLRIIHFVLVYKWTVDASTSFRNNEEMIFSDEKLLYCWQIFPSRTSNTCAISGRGRIKSTKVNLRLRDTIRIDPTFRLLWCNAIDHKSFLRREIKLSGINLFFSSFFLFLHQFYHRYNTFWSSIMR